MQIAAAGSGFGSGSGSISAAGGQRDASRSGTTAASGGSDGDDEASAAKSRSRSSSSSSSSGAGAGAVAGGEDDEGYKSGDTFTSPKFHDQPFGAGMHAPALGATEDAKRFLWDDDDSGPAVSAASIIASGGDMTTSVGSAIGGGIGGGYRNK